MDGDNSSADLNVTNNTSLTIMSANEIKTLINIPITYSMVSMTGEMHNPKYIWKTECFGVFAYGIGSSKKNAKRNSAYNFFEKVKQENLYDTLNLKHLSNHIAVNMTDKNYTEQLLNPVSILQELCSKMYWDPPKYTYELTDFENPTYEAVCTIRLNSFKGNGKTKKNAKREAAQMMYNEFVLWNRVDNN